MANRGDEEVAYDRLSRRLLVNTIIGFLFFIVAALTTNEKNVIERKYGEDSTIILFLLIAFGFGLSLRAAVGDDLRLARYANTIKTFPAFVCLYAYVDDFHPLGVLALSWIIQQSGSDLWDVYDDWRASRV